MPPPISSIRVANDRFCSGGFLIGALVILGAAAGQRIRDVAAGGERLPNAILLCILLVAIGLFLVVLAQDGQTTTKLTSKVEQLERKLAERSPN